MKGGADIYDQNEIRRHVEAGDVNVETLARKLFLTPECVQSWVDYFNGKPLPVAEKIKLEKIDVSKEAVDTWVDKQNEKVKNDAVITSKKSQHFGKDNGDSE